MARFQDLPIEVVDVIFRTCHEFGGRSTLVKMMSLNKDFMARIQPILSRSVDLTEIGVDDKKVEESDEGELERKFRGLIYDFLPIYRQDITQISISLTSTDLKSNRNRFQYDLNDIFEDPLDKIYSEILGLLTFLKDLRIKFPNSSEKSLHGSDYPLTISSIKRLSRLESLQLSGSIKNSETTATATTTTPRHNYPNGSLVPNQIRPSPRPHQPSSSSQEFLSQFLSSVLPSLKSLQTLSLEKLSIVLPKYWWPSTDPPISVTHLRLFKVELWDSGDEGEGNRSLDSNFSMTPIQDFFRPFLTTLQRIELAIDCGTLMSRPSFKKPALVEDSVQDYSKHDETINIRVLNLNSFSLTVLNKKLSRPGLRNKNSSLLSSKVDEDENQKDEVLLSKAKEFEEQIKRLILLFKECPINHLNLKNVFDNDRNCCYYDVEEFLKKTWTV